MQVVITDDFFRSGAPYNRWGLGHLSTIPNYRKTVARTCSFPTSSYSSFSKNNFSILQHIAGPYSPYGIFLHLRTGRYNTLRDILDLEVSFFLDILFFL